MLQTDCDSGWVCQVEYDEFLSWWIMNADMVRKCLKITDYPKRFFILGSHNVVDDSDKRIGSLTTPHTLVATDDKGLIPVQWRGLQPSVVERIFEDNDDDDDEWTSAAASAKFNGDEVRARQLPQKFS